MTGREEILQIYYNTNFHAKKQNKKYHILTTLLLFSHKVVSDFFANPCQASLFFTISESLFKFTSIELVMLSNHLILCLSLLLLPSIFPSIRVLPLSNFLNQKEFNIRFKMREKETEAIRN